MLRADGTVVGATGQAGRSVLTAGQLARARTADVRADRPGDAMLDESVRLLAVGVRASGEPLVVVVGASLDEKREALASLLTLEVIGLTGALLLASAAGYLVAGVALRPVEAMRRRAEEITGQPDLRLPVPTVDDELGRLGSTLNAMLDRLAGAQAAERRAMAQERRFVADASHELRTPLTIMRSEIDVALYAAREAGELRAALESTGAETDRLCRLAEDLLVLAQADDGRLPVRAQPVDAGELLEAVADRERPRAAAAGRRLLTHVPAGLQLHADRLRLEQALGNLIDNALRHGAGDVDLSARSGDGTVDLEVRDHGAGFPDGFADHAFERFSRAGVGRTGAGAGLGLAIVHAVADAHGGSAVAGNAVPGGQVRVSLPVPQR